MFVHVDSVYCHSIASVVVAATIGHGCGTYIRVILFELDFLTGPFTIWYLPVGLFISKVLPDWRFFSNETLTNLSGSKLHCH